jgi:hypothetical protein
LGNRDTLGSLALIFKRRQVFRLIFLLFDAHQIFGDAKEVNHLSNTKQWSYDNHPAETTLEESSEAFILESSPKKSRIFEHEI